MQKKKKKKKRRKKNWVLWHRPVYLHRWTLVHTVKKSKISTQNRGTFPVLLLLGEGTISLG